MIILLHWLVALTVVGLFALGWWMVDLNYYHAWYKTAPDTHESIGLILFFMLIVRLLIRTLTATPAPLSSYAKWEQWLAQKTHWILYLLLFVVMFSGYLSDNITRKPRHFHARLALSNTVTHSCNTTCDLAGITVFS